jgi:dipeptidase
MFAPDVVTFAQAQGFYPANADPLAFSFSDTYNPLSFEGARACEARVWSFFNKFSDVSKWLDYAQGYNLSNRMPLFMKPNHSLSVIEIEQYMRDHFEGTWFDFAYRDVGATAFEAPYRWRPLDYNVGGKMYTNERAVSTQQTATTLVAQMRSFLPNEIGGVLWFGVDDSAMSVHAPLYCGITDIPKSLVRGNTPGIINFSFNSAFWVFNLVSNLVYTRYNTIYPEVLQTILNTEDTYRQSAGQIEKMYLKMIAGGKANKGQAIAMLTNYSVSTFDALTQNWLQYFTYLFVKYCDGNIKTNNAENPWVPNIAQPGYGQDWYDLIVYQTGTHYLETSAAPKVSKNVNSNRPPRFASKSRARKL